MEIRRLILFLLFFLATGFGARAAETNSMVWQPDTGLVTADIHSEALWPLLEDIAHQTGWHIFVEPNASHDTSAKFRNLREGEALHKLLGNLNFALVPQTNGPQQLYVFTTIMGNATQRVSSTVHKAKPMKHVPNQLMVRLKPGANIDAIAKAYGAKVVSRNDKLGIYLLEFSDASATDSALGSLKVDQNVASVDYNYLYDLPAQPQQLANAPNGAGQLTLTADATSNSDPCHPVIGLIDTGVQPLGSQLDQFITKRLDVTGDNATLSPTTPAHGTAMAQAILQGIQQQSTTSRARIISVNVFGSDETASTWNVALGVQAAVEGGATVLNMSLAGGTDSAVLEDIIKQALAKNVVIFAAAGNEPVDTPNYPAAISGVNAVTALSSPGQLASYANFGSFVEMALPGTAYVNLGGQAWVVQGTSPATAFASGIAAGAKAVNCDSWSQIESAMAKKFQVPNKSK